VEALFGDALGTLERALGLTVERIEAGDVLRSAGLPGANADDDWVTTVACEQAHQLGRAFIEENEERFDPPFRAAMRLGLGVTIDEYIGARRRRYAYARALDELLADGIVLATPTMPFEGFTADGRMPGAERPGTDSAAYNNQVQNMTGHPALTVPAGRSPNGVPFGLQLTAPRFRDDLLLDLADAWDRTFPRAGAAPGYEPFWPA
jgi:amidase/aspartyl-tRNA(Asn)/glutamyl-tRNA(Gln) amidotransferase subunit A